MSYIKAPSEDKQEMYDYLEVLRQSGATNMFGATPYLIKEFPISEREARDILSDWMDGHRDPKRIMKKEEL